MRAPTCGGAWCPDHDEEARRRRKQERGHSPPAGDVQEQCLESQRTRGDEHYGRESFDQVVDRIQDLAGGQDYAHAARFQRDLGALGDGDDTIQRARNGKSHQRICERIFGLFLRGTVDMASQCAGDGQ